MFGLFRCNQGGGRILVLARCHPRHDLHRTTIRTSGLRDRFPREMHACEWDAWAEKQNACGRGRWLRPHLPAANRFLRTVSRVRHLHPCPRLKPPASGRAWEVDPKAMVDVAGIWTPRVLAGGATRSCVVQKRRDRWVASVGQLTCNEAGLASDALHAGGRVGWRGGLVLWRSRRP